MSKNARGSARRLGKAGETESRGNLLQKIKFYEDEMGRYASKKLDTLYLNLIDLQPYLYTLMFSQMKSGQAEYDADQMYSLSDSQHKLIASSLPLFPSTFLFLFYLDSTWSVVVYFSS